MSALIEVKGLSKSFGNLQVLENVDFTVNKGDRIAIIGGSGCGKSVFLRSIELLEQPDRGQIYIDGEEITAKGAKVPDIRRKLGMVYQNFNLFSHMDVMDNLCLAPVKLKKIPRAEAEEQAYYWLSQIGLTSKAHSETTSLSGGQKQRIAICRALMMDPKVILFDEPTSALDPTMVGEVLAMIRMLGKRDLTMIIVTHEMKFAKDVANRVCFFADKGIYEEGTPEEIFDHPRREKTIAFIQRMKFFRYEVSSKDFDLLEFHGGLSLFGEKYNIDSKLIWRLQLCCEELIYRFLEKSFPNGEKADILTEVSYADNGSISLKISCSGREYNPFGENTDSPDEDALGIIIVKKVSKEFLYSFEDNRNAVSVTF